MFSFHKPKVYRSSTGCCICKAKSSSSRFTDSKKYELDFISCFQLSTPRKGEICNACVLLVKRFKRLPPGSERHWGHVVDARVGPGLKSMTKFKKRKEDQKETNATKKVTENGAKCTVTEKFCKIFKKTKKKKTTADEEVKQEQQENSAGSSDESSPTSPASSVSDADLTENKMDLKPSISSLKRKNFTPLKNKRPADLNIIDLSVWKKRKTCCGLTYESMQFSAVIVDLATHKPCKLHTRKSPVAELEQELDCRSEDLLIKLTDEQIQENYEKATQVKQIVKISDLFSAVPPPQQTTLKKHQMYSKRGIADNNKTEMTSTIITDTIPTPPQPLTLDVIEKSKADVKVPKNPITTLKIKTIDFKKDFIRGTTEKQALKAKLNGAEGVIGDNSSDSGYEEAHDQAQNLMLKPKTTPKQVMLMNGMKVHLPNTQNLLLASTLAGLPSTTTIMPAPFQKPIVSEQTSVIRLQSSGKTPNKGSQNLLIIHPTSSDQMPTVITASSNIATTSNLKSTAIHTTTTNNTTADVISLATNEQLPSSPPRVSPPILHPSSVN